jgi:hypothetical protein
LQPFPSKFQDFEIFVWFGISSNSSNEHAMNMYFHRRGHSFVVQKTWNQLYDFMHSFWLLKKKMYFKHLIMLVYKTQNDIYSSI